MFFLSSKDSLRLPCWLQHAAPSLTTLQLFVDWNLSWITRMILVWSLFKSPFITWITSVSCSLWRAESAQMRCGSTVVDLGNKWPEKATPTQMNPWEKVIWKCTHRDELSMSETVSLTHWELRLGIHTKLFQLQAKETFWDTANYWIGKLLDPKLWHKPVSRQENSFIKTECKMTVCICAPSLVMSFWQLH